MQSENHSGQIKEQRSKSEVPSSRTAGCMLSEQVLVPPRATKYLLNASAITTGFISFCSFNKLTASFGMCLIPYAISL